MPNEDAILRKALETYGSAAQINMVFEEMSELQKGAVQKPERER